ncbi:hypothetical protein FOZ63_014730, partial [Perkinsus olseni]
SDAQLEAYMESVRDDMDKGHVPTSSLTGRFIRAFCVHDPVSVSTPIRVVLDARPDNLFTHAFPVGERSSSSSLEGNLLYWRSGRYYFSMDISKAFLSLSIHPADRPYCGVQAAGCTLQFGAVYFGAGWAPRGLQESTEHLKGIWKDDLQGLPPRVRFLPDERRAVAPDLVPPAPPAPTKLPSPDDIDSLKLYLDDVVAAGSEPERLLVLRDFARYKFSRHGLHCNPLKDNHNLPSQDHPADDAKTSRHLGYSYLPASDELVMAYGTGRGSCSSTLPETTLTRAQAVSVLSALFDP